MKDDELKRQIDRQVRRMKKAEDEQPNLFAQTVYLGTLGLVFILPVLVGAFVGLWLDEKVSGFSTHWTVSLIFTGVIVGVVNVYLFIRE